MSDQDNEADVEAEIEEQEYIERTADRKAPTFARLPAAQQSQSATSLMQLIERAAVNPAVDIDKVERLFKMHREILAHDAEAEYNVAFAMLQGELPTIARNGAIVMKDKVTGKLVTQSHYSRFEDIHRAVQPLLVLYGFALSFRIESTPLGPRVAGKLMHRGGHHEVTPFLDVPNDKTGSKNSAQAVGSAISYGKRYVLCALLNINTEGEDNDAQGTTDDDRQPTQQQQERRPAAEPRRQENAKAGGSIDDGQIKVLLAAIMRVGIPESEFLAKYELGQLNELPFDKLNEALNFIKGWKPAALDNAGA